MRRMRENESERIARLIKAKGIPCRVEQTGGGVQNVTINLGPGGAWGESEAIIHGPHAGGFHLALYDGKAGGEPTEDLIIGTIQPAAVAQAALKMIREMHAEPDTENDNPCPCTVCEAGS